MTRLEIITQQPKKDAGLTPLLFVHGGWHGAWCWEFFQSYFAEQGYVSHALNLRGHSNFCNVSI
jgi:pimeloyl-ACP methyl ester carboxylesterase